ncbi:hypothetical protein, partial [Cronobacter dublinensis]
WSFQTPLCYVLLQTWNHAPADFDSFSKGEIIPFSGFSKTGSSLFHARGAGHSLCCPGGTALQPPTTSSNNALKVNDVPLSACQLLLGIFRIYRSHIALRVPHIHNSIFIQI